jgi:general secretion pathway protein K
MSSHLNLKNQHRQMLRLKHQEGVAMVMALFIVALVVALSYLMMSRLERDTRRTGLILYHTEAEFYAAGSVAWAMDQLYNNWIRQKTNQRIDVMPMTSSVNEVNGYHIVSTIDDMQARFNLNNLSNVSNGEAQASFILLLQAVSTKLTAAQAKALAEAVTDWVTPSQAPNPQSEYYATRSTPYRAAHRLLLSVSELRLVKGMNAELFQALQPFVVALPQPTPINVETAEAPVLMSLSADIPLDVAKAIIMLRQETPFVSPQTFYHLDIMKNHHVTSSNVTTCSSYFLVQTKVNNKMQHLVLYTLLERSIVNSRAVIQIVWQSKGMW